MNDRSGGSLRASFVTVTTLFFTWGFITSVIDPLIPSVRAIFSLNYAESMLTQFAFFMAYGVLSLPGGMIVARWGYANSILTALLAMVAGCLIIVLATQVDTYALVLAGLFVIAGGMTILQVAANPLAAALGAPERSHFRLTLSQAFNSLGTVIGPIFGAHVMLRGGMFTSTGDGGDHAAARAASLRNIDHSFLIVAVLLVLLVAFMWWARRRLSSAAQPARAAAGISVLDALKSPWALFGAAAIFFYVGAEVSIGSIMINFLHESDVLGSSLERAGTLLGLFYWGGAMVGRFAGSALLTRLRAHRLLAAVALGATLFCLIVNQSHGGLAAVVVLSIGLLNAIMFPTIFTLTLERSTASSAATSGLLCMAIVGGAVLPRIVGHIADVAGLHAAYLVPMAAYACIAAFALAAGRARLTEHSAVAQGLAH
ncbi:MAG TPA: sugar MFS transporter [Steroidobacteraceae bacterium]